VKSIIDVANTALGKKKWRYDCRLFETNSLKEGAIVYSFVVNDSANTFPRKSTPARIRHLFVGNDSVNISP
jgi:hypothetical protein